MEVILAIALGLTIGGVVGWFWGMHFATTLFGRSVRREMEAGRITHEEAGRLTDLKNLPSGLESGRPLRRRRR